MPDFDAALDFQGAVAIRAWVASDDVTQVGNGRNRQIAFPVNAEVVLVVDVGTDTEVAHQFDGAVDDDWQRQVQRAEGARARANGVTQFGIAGHDQRAGHAWLVRSLDLVEFVVATDDQGNQLAFFLGMHDQSLDGLFNRQIEFFHQCGNGFGVWSVDQAQLFARCGTRGFARHGFGFLDVRRVVGTVAEDDIVFAGFGQHVEFVGTSTTDGAVVSFHRAEFQAQTGEHVAVRLVHAVVGDLQRWLVSVE
ncbi:hypothetical protein D3C71_861810 [compost metagenome]